MKNFYLPLIFVLLIFSSCFKIEHFQYKKEDLMDVNLFLNKEKGSYKSTGSYLYEKDTVIANYTVDDKYYLDVIRINNVTTNYTINIEGNKPLRSVNAGYAILPGGDYELNYNLSELSKIKKKKSLHFSSDGNISNLIFNDTLKVYSMRYKNLTLYFNDKPDIRMYTEIYNVRKNELVSDIAFYKKNNDIYFLIFTSITDRDIKEGTLLEYLKH